MLRVTGREGARGTGGGKAQGGDEGEGILGEWKGMERKAVPRDFILGWSQGSRATPYWREDRQRRYTHWPTTFCDAADQTTPRPVITGPLTLHPHGGIGNATRHTHHPFRCIAAKFLLHRDRGTPTAHPQPRSNCNGHMEELCHHQ